MLPAQTRDEYFRNRNRIAEQSRELLVREAELKLTFPAPFVKEWSEATTVRTQVEATRKAYKALLKKYDLMVSEEKTPSDVLIKHLFATADIFEEDEALLRKAHFRYLKGHPPRKNDGSFGDAIAWELLLAQTNDDLVVITKDSDFSESRQGTTSLNGFLEREWRTKNTNHSIELYISLGEFINAFERREAVKSDVVQKEKSYALNTVLTYPIGPGGVSIVGSNATPFFAQPGGASIAGNNATPFFAQPSGVSIVGNNATPFLTGPGVISVGNSEGAYLTGPGVITFGNPVGSYFVNPGTVISEGNTTYADDSETSSSIEAMGSIGVAKYCPHCKNDITTALSAISSSAKSASGLHKFTCPHCKSGFDRDTIGEHSGG